MTREEATRILRCDGFTSNPIEIDEALNMAVKALEEARPHGAWIPVSERFPEEGKSVLVWYEYYAYGTKNRMVQTYGIGHVYDGFWVGDVQGTKSKCIAWMPLPEPYKKEGDEK